MLQYSNPTEVYKLCEAKRRKDYRVGLVPTMGFLHDGHLSLIERAREVADFVVVSIFVNPTQFCPGEDFDQYPSDLPGDLEKCRAAGADLVFTPSKEVIYPKGYQTYVEVERISQGLCGANRPGHFRGVCTVVTKLFNIIGPCVAVFGEKDYQQLQVIRQMVRDLSQPVEIIGCPTIREADGLAKSSRNAYLNEGQRRSAGCLYRALKRIHDQVKESQKAIRVEELISTAQHIITKEPETRIEYIEARDSVTLEPVERIQSGRVVVAMAIFVGRTRLIDNMII